MPLRVWLIESELHHRCFPSDNPLLKLNTYTLFTFLQYEILTNLLCSDIITHGINALRATHQIQTPRWFHGAIHSNNPVIITFLNIKRRTTDFHVISAVKCRKIVKDNSKNNKYNKNSQKLKIKTKSNH